MSVLAKGWKMPRDCIVCPFGWNGCNHQHDYVYMGERPDDCPLVEIPPHGRLIDADALPDRFDEVRDLAPTIIEAEECE